MFLIFVISFDVLKISAPNASEAHRFSKCDTDVLVEPHPTFLISIVACLMLLPACSGSPVRSPVPQWHSVLKQHGRKFKAQRIMATSCPQGAGAILLISSLLLGQAVHLVLCRVNIPRHMWGEGGHGGSVALFPHRKEFSWSLVVFS